MCENHQQEWMTQCLKDAVDMSLDHVAKGGIPFAALVVNDDGEVLGRGVNRVREAIDPTSHAEVEAIRDAARRTGAPYLAGTTLIASGEPCAMCYMNAVFAGVKEIIFVADRNEAAQAGFDYASAYALFNVDPQDWTAPRVRKAPVENGLDPFERFKERFL